MSVITREFRRADGTQVLITGGREHVREFAKLERMRIRSESTPVTNELVTQVPREFVPEPFLAPVLNYDGDEPRIVYGTKQEKDALGTPLLMPSLFD